MAVLTQLRPDATPGKRYATFAPKEASANGPHDPGLCTTLRPDGTPGKRYAAFEAKGGAAPEPEPTPAVNTVPGGGGGYGRRRVSNVPAEPPWERTRPSEKRREPERKPEPKREPEPRPTARREKGRLPPVPQFGGWRGTEAFEPAPLDATARGRLPALPALVDASTLELVPAPLDAFEAGTLPAPPRRGLAGKFARRVRNDDHAALGLLAALGGIDGDVAGLIAWAESEAGADVADVEV